MPISVISIGDQVAGTATHLLPAIIMERNAQFQFKISDNKDAMYFPADQVQRSSEF